MGILRVIAPLSVAGLVVVAVAGCGENRSTAKSAQSAPAASLPVTVAPAQTRRVQRSVDFVGTLEAKHQVIVAAEIEGQIESIRADLGDRVGAGQVLARIHDAEFRYAVRQAEGALALTLARLGLTTMPSPEFDVDQTSAVLKAKAELDEAALHFERMKALFGENIISAQEFDSADTRYKTAQAAHRSAVEQAKAMVADAAVKEAQLLLARKKLQDTVVAAPLAGSIGKRFVSAGEYVKVAAPLFTIMQDDVLKLTGMIPERFSPEIRPGQIVEAKVDSAPERTFQGKISRVSPATDVASRSFAIEAVIDNPERQLKPGFFAHATVLTRIEPSALTVPRQAVVTFAGVSKVFVVENDRARERVVQTAARVGTNEIEITAGLKPGQWVAVSGLTRLVDGAAVIVNEPATSRREPEGSQ